MSCGFEVNQRCLFSFTELVKPLCKDARTDNITGVSLTPATNLANHETTISLDLLNDVFPFIRIFSHQ